MDNADWRLEAVWQQDVPLRPGCLVVLGDSRAAFQVNAAKLSTPHCSGHNYAFPALSTASIKALLADRISQGERPTTVLLVINETHFSSSTVVSQSSIQAGYGGTNLLTQFSPDLVKYRFVRQAILPIRRVQVLVSAAAGEAVPNNGWMWEPKLGRWVGTSLDRRILEDLPTFF